jgi:RNA polymerase sigma-70 factor, ECF subfamily
MSTDPASLLQRLQTRTDHEAWERFVELYAPLLYFWACRLHLQAADAADLVQEVFLAVLRKMPEFRLEQHRSFRAWLRTLTHNKWCDLCRRRGAALRGADDRGLAGASVPDAVADLCEAEYRRHLVGRALRVMQAEFQPTTWRACWEVVVSGRAAAAVAAELGLSVAAVYAAKYRVLRRLRQELRGLLD